MAKKPGPAPLYGDNAVRVSTYAPADLVTVLDADVLEKNKEAGDPNASSRSRRIVEILAKFYRLKLPVPPQPQESR